VEKVKIMIADDHMLIRRAVRQVVEREEDMEIVAEACNGYEAATQAAQVQPDVVLMDLDMPGCDGFQATERVLACSPHSRVVIFTASQHEQHAIHALQLGAVGYLTKDIEPDNLVKAIRQAARDELCMPRPLATRLLAHLRSLPPVMAPTRGATTFGTVQKHSFAVHNQDTQKPATLSPEAPTSTHPLTRRELEIIALIRKGHKNREIAGELGIAESTVHKHVQNIFEKLHARNRTEAIYLMSVGTARG